MDGIHSGLIIPCGIVQDCNYFAFINNRAVNNEDNCIFAQGIATQTLTATSSSSLVFVLFTQPNSTAGCLRNSVIKYRNVH